MREITEARCDECDRVTVVPHVSLWPGIDKILCRYCGNDLREQTIGKLDVRPSWAGVRVNEGMEVRDDVGSHGDADVRRCTGREPDAG